MRAKAGPQALVQGTSLDRVEAIDCKVKTGQSSLPQFSLDGETFACRENCTFTTSDLLASEEISDACRKDVVVK
jgi:hypothetical protein